MAKSIVDSDPDDSGPQKIKSGYSRQASREYTQDELYEMARQARKEGKRDTLISLLVEQQDKTARTLDNVTNRLTEGDKDMARLDESYKRLEIESNVRLQALTEVSKQAAKATLLIQTHIDQCNERKQNEDKRSIEEDRRWNEVKKSLDNPTKRHRSDGKESMWDKVGVNVISAVLVAAVMGGLVGYFLIYKGLGNETNTNAGNDNKDKSTSIKDK